MQDGWGGGSRPIVLALSNPSEVAECTAQQAYDWSGGRAVYASGTAFPPFQTHHGLVVPAQANNSLIFPGRLPCSPGLLCRLCQATVNRFAVEPGLLAQSHSHKLDACWSPRIACMTCFAGYGYAAGVGLGCIAASAKQITADIMLAAAKAAAIKLTQEELEQDSILPAVDRIRQVVPEALLRNGLAAALTAIAVMPKAFIYRHVEFLLEPGVDRLLGFRGGWHSSAS